MFQIHDKTGEFGMVSLSSAKHAVKCKQHLPRPLDLHHYTFHITHGQRSPQNDPFRTARPPGAMPCTPGPGHEKGKEENRSQKSRYCVEKSIGTSAKQGRTMERRERNIRIINRKPKLYPKKKESRRRKPKARKRKRRLVDQDNHGRERERWE